MGAALVYSDPLRRPRILRLFLLPNPRSSLPALATLAAFFPGKVGVSFLRILLFGVF